MLKLLALYIIALPLLVFPILLAFTDRVTCHRGFRYKVIKKELYPSSLIMCTLILYDKYNNIIEELICNYYGKDMENSIIYQMNSADTEWSFVFWGKEIVGFCTKNKTFFFLEELLKRQKLDEGKNLFTIIGLFLMGGFVMSLMLCYTIYPPTPDSGAFFDKDFRDLFLFTWPIFSLTFMSIRKIIFTYSIKKIKYIFENECQ